MSFWAATVITNLVTTVPYFGDSIIILIHGGFSVGAVTLNRFFILHFLSAILLIAVIAAHINTLHTYGSSTRYHCVRTDEDKVPFFYFYIYKDIQIAIGIFIVLLGISLSYPNVLNHPDNFVEANSMVTPAHIVPE
jgi:ubiquinol-cytochrome c reductase cytochrome b subunit